MYDNAIIVNRMRDALKLKPTQRLTEVAQSLQIDRHTLARALKSHGLEFNQLRAEYILRAVRSLSTASPLRSHKEVAYLLGFRSPSAFSHYLKRYAKVETATFSSKSQAAGD